MPHLGDRVGARMLVVLATTALVVTSFTGVPMASATPPRPHQALPHQGEQSPAVARVQQLLQAAGVRVPGGADGVYGPATAKAVATFQTARGLPPTGAVDDATAVALGYSPPAPILAQGAAGDGVKAVQRQLATAGVRVPGGADGVFGPATAKAVARYQAARGLTATGQVDALTAALLRGGVPIATAPATPQASKGVTIAAFPLPTTCRFWDTWHALRSGGRLHVGVDVFAKVGTPVYAVEAGRITRQRADFPGSLGGNQMWLTAKDGDAYFYGHLNAFAKGVGAGSPVRAGDVIGYSGATGLTSVPHLHFEIHPGGGAPINPFPVLKAKAGC